MGLGYVASDIFTTSEMEKKRNDYIDLIKDVNKNIWKAEDYCRDLRVLVEKENRVMSGSSSDGSGMLAAFYDGEMDEFISKTEKLILYFEAKIKSAKLNVVTAGERLEYYKKQCKAEDKQEKEIKE